MGPRKPKWQMFDPKRVPQGLQKKKRPKMELVSGLVFGCAFSSKMMPKRFPKVFLASSISVPEKTLVFVRIFLNYTPPSSDFSN